MTTHFQSHFLLATKYSTDNYNMLKYMSWTCIAKFCYTPISIKKTFLLSRHFYTWNKYWSSERTQPRLLSNFEHNYLLVKSSDIEGIYWLGWSTSKWLRHYPTKRQSFKTRISKYVTRPAILLAITNLSSGLHHTGMIFVAKFVFYNKEKTTDKLNIFILYCTIWHNY